MHIKQPFFRPAPNSIKFEKLRALANGPASGRWAPESRICVHLICSTGAGGGGGRFRLQAGWARLIDARQAQLALAGRRAAQIQFCAQAAPS